MVDIMVFIRNAFPMDDCANNALKVLTAHVDRIQFANMCNYSYNVIGIFKMVYELMLSAASKPTASVFSAPETVDTVVTPKQAMKCLRIMHGFDRKNLSQCSALLTHTTSVGNHILMVRLRRALLF